MASSNNSETVRVIVRCRPMNQREIELKSRPVIKMETKSGQAFLENIDNNNEPPKQFTFDAVYPEDSTTETLYTDSVFSLVESVLEGYNGTVFAYGQTGCGKSFTMQGINTAGSLQRGVIPRSFEHIFEASSVSSGVKYLIQASYLEIYNETIRDLLSKDVKATLDLKEFPDKGVQVANLTWHRCTNVVDCEKLMEKGNRSRATGATLMNKDSSRSHSIFTIITEVCEKSQIDGKEHIRAGKLNLVDLAGSERQSKTQAEGERLREATKINLSLSALGNVISALVDGRSKHIPYRDSKLTRLLQDSLGGNTKTLMIAAISPALDNYDETLSTLRYANRAKNIKNRPRINEDPRDAQMKLLQEEIARLRQELSNLGHIKRPLTASNRKMDENQEFEKLRDTFEREASDLRRQFESERRSKQDLEKNYQILQEQFQSKAEDLSKNRRKNVVGPKEKLERLHELENLLVGGEDANNEERKRKRKNKLAQMKEKQRTTKASQEDEDQTLFRVFNNAQEELEYTLKQIQREVNRKTVLSNENEDLQKEFERDRFNYCTTIREQEKQILLFETMMKQLSTMIDRRSNYRNPEKIMDQARYDDETGRFVLPDAVIEEIQFPQVNQSLSSTNVRSQQFYPTPRHHEKQLTDDFEQDFTKKFESISVGPSAPVRNSRQIQLMNENAQKRTSLNNADNDYMNRRLTPFDVPDRISRKYGFSTDK